MKSNNLKYDASLDEAASAIAADNRGLIRTALESVLATSSDRAEMWLMRAWSCDSLQETEIALQQALEIEPNNEIAVAGLNWIHGIQELADFQLAAKRNAEEAQRQAEEEAQRQAEAQRRAEEEAQHRAEEEARLQAEEEDRLQAEEEAQLLAEVAAQRMAEEESQRQAAEARLQAEEESQRQAEEALLKAVEEARLQAAEEDRLQAEEKSRRLLNEESRQRAEEEARHQAEETRLKVEAEAKRQAEEESPRLAELEKPEIEKQPELERQAQIEAAGEESRLAEFAQQLDSSHLETASSGAPENELKESVDALAQEVQQEIQSIENNTTTTISDNARSSKKQLVLAVDDSPTVRKLVSLTLSREGFEVITAVDGIEALNILSEQLPDIILSDINMPKLNGYKLCKFVKKHERTQSIPVVMLSGKEGVFDKMRGKMNGCDDFITKPFESAELVAKVREILSGITSQ